MCKWCLCCSDNRLEELQEKYNQEVEERKRLETELKVLQVKVSKLNNLLFFCVVFLCGTCNKFFFLQMVTQSSVSVSHKDIAARQAGSSIFPWQQQDHSIRAPNGMETPLKRQGTSLWEAHEETPIKPGQRMGSSRTVQSPSGSSNQMEQLKTLNQGGSFCES